MRFIEFGLSSDALCMGERIKGGIFCPCARTIRYSQISGALRKKFGESEIHAVGYLLEGNGYNETDYLIYSPRDKMRAVSKIPLRVEFLTNVRGKVYVLENKSTAGMPERFEIFMGALVSKGLGLCGLNKCGVIEAGQLKPGILRTRIPVDKLDLFGVRERRGERKPVYGYLFQPTSLTSGVYVLSLFEGSEVIAPEFLISTEERG